MFRALLCLASDKNGYDIEYIEDVVCRSHFETAAQNKLTKIKVYTQIKPAPIHNSELSIFPNNPAEKCMDIYLCI